MPFLAMEKKVKKILYIESTFHVLHYEQKELHTVNLEMVIEKDYCSD